MLQYNVYVTFQSEVSGVIRTRTKAGLEPERPVAAAVSLIGSRWKVLILCDLMDRPRRFNERRRDLDGVGQNTDRLRSISVRLFTTKRR